MFKENDLVMYGKTGVCRVLKIGTPDFAVGDSNQNSSKKLYYFLEPLYHSGTFYAPIDAAQIALRPVISGRAPAMPFASSSAPVTGSARP